MINHASTQNSSKGALARLRGQFKNLALLDADGEWVGQVRDLKVASDGNLHLIVAGEDEEHQPLLFTISTNFIQKIEPGTQSLYVSLSVEQIKQLPSYLGQDSPNFLTKSPETSVSKSSPSREPINSSQFVSNKTLNQMDHYQISDQSPVSGNEDLPSTVEDYQIRLLEERLVVDRKKRKVGEVVVRKTIETEMIQVPVRREKLIIEQISPETKQLAEIDLHSSETLQAEVAEAVENLPQKSLVKGEFRTPQAAARMLEVIANQSTYKPAKVRVEIVLENGEDLTAYQEWFNRYSKTLNQES